MTLQPIMRRLLPISLVTITAVMFVGVALSYDASPSAEASRRMRKLSLGLQEYAVDYDGQLPPMQNAAVAKEALFPYVRESAVFEHPVSKDPYLPNPALSYQKYVRIIKTKVVAFYQAKPGVDGRRDVLFVYRPLEDKEDIDYMQHLSAAEWLRVKQASKIP